MFRWPAKWGRYLPGPLAALIVGTVASLGLSTVPVLGNIRTGLPQFIMPAFSSDTLLIVFEAAMILAVLGAIDSLLLLAVVVVLAPLASKIPHAVLAGILVKVGYDIIDVSYLKRAHRGPRFDLALMVMVLSLTVFVISSLPW